MPSQPAPTMLDFLGAILLAGICGGVGAMAGSGLAILGVAWTPTSWRRATPLGSVAGLGYLPAWVGALHAVRSLVPGTVTTRVAGGLAAVVAAVGVAALLWIELWAVERFQIGSVQPYGVFVFTALFAGVLAGGFAVLLPVLLPVLVP